MVNTFLLDVVLVKARGYVEFLKILTYILFATLFDMVANKIKVQAMPFITILLLMP